MITKQRKRYFAELNGHSKKFLKLREKHFNKIRLRFLKLGITPNEFLNSSPTKSTLLYYMTESNFKKLEMQPEYIIMKSGHVVKGYKLISVLEKVIEKNIAIRFKKFPLTYLTYFLFKDKPDKHDFIRECFKFIERKRKEEELRAKLIDKNDVNTIKTKKKI